jgi:hypothetical protein
MNRQLKVFMIPYKRFDAVARGESKILNWPPDGKTVQHHEIEQLGCRTGVALLVTSASFPEVPIGVPPPVVTAVFAKEVACA